MDKRSLLFVAALSIAFFCVHAWFDSQGEKERLAYAKKVQEEKIVKQRQLEAEVAARTAKLDELPIASLFSDSKGTEKVATGIACGDAVLTLAWNDSLPTKLYASIKGKNEALQLAAAPTQIGQPALYRKTQTAAPIQAPAIPMDQPVDIQLVALGSEIRIALGENRGKQCHLPFHHIGEAAIALIKSGESYLPVGIYDPQEKRVRALSDFQKLATMIQQAQTVPLAQSESGEKFYVLENEYQQLVFSTRGGALAEINLPLKSKTDSKSLVKEIDIDRQILSTSPQNAHFPLHPYYSAGEKGTVFSEEGALGGYYPLLRRAILNKDGAERSSVSPEYYALNIVGDDPQISSMQYKVARFEKNLIQFVASNGQRKIVKTFSIPEEKNGPYCLLLDMQIEGDSRGLWLSSGVPDVEIVSGSYSPLLRFQVTRNGGSDVDTIDLPKKEMIEVSSLRPNWISNNNGFLGLILDPLTDIGQGYRAAQIDGTKLPTRLTAIDSRHQLYKASDYPGYATYLPLKSGAPLSFRIFAGPFDDVLLKQLDALYDNPLTHYNPEYTMAQSIQGWFSFISEPFAKFLFFLMQIFHAVTQSWAASIILLTIALKAMMYPLNAWSIRSSIKMQAIGPKVQAIQERYKKDPKKGQMEIINLYKESGANPLVGCLPMLLQMPFLLGMFYLLKSSFPLRGASFVPGWIDDLAAPDILFTWDQPLWFIGNEFHLLPILMGFSMYLQQKLTSTLPKDARQLTEQQKQQKMMGIIMSVFLAVMFYSFPSGLNIYFMFSTLLGVLQQWWMMKKINPATILGPSKN